MVNIAAFIQARTGSTRFPNKVNAMLRGKRVLDWVLEAATRIEGVTAAYVLWPECYKDVAEEDVLGRFYTAAQDYGYDAFVRLTADCPLLDPQVSSLVVNTFKRLGRQYVSNVFPDRTWPDGLDTEVFTRSALEQAHLKATDPYDREHVTTWMQRNLTYGYVYHPVDWSHIRLTVDTPEDLQWLETCIQFHGGFWSTHGGIPRAVPRR